MIGIKIRWIVHFNHLEYGGGFGEQDKDSDDDEETLKNNDLD